MKWFESGTEPARAAIDEDMPFSKGHLFSRLLLLPRLFKQILVLTADIVLCALTLWVAYWLRLENWITFSPVEYIVLAASIAIGTPLFIRFGLYRAILRYSGRRAFINISQALALYGLIFITIFSLIGVDGVPRSVPILQTLLLFLSISSTRLLAQFLFNLETKLFTKYVPAERFLIYGAGVAGQQMALALTKSKLSEVIGFVDQDPLLQGRFIEGYRVFHPEKIKLLVETKKVSGLILAMPDSTKQQRQAILESLRDLPLKIRTTANLVDLASGRSSISDLSELDVEDLLDRHGVEPDQVLLKGTVHQKVVLVTGAGGSIGSELCRQILRCNPKTLLLLEFNEYALYQIEQQLQLMLQAEIQNRTLSVQVIPLLGSTLNRLRIAEIMRLWRPETVYHAAAYKHVPLVEHNPVEGIRNNVFGTLICAEAALEYNVLNFVLISTDKAVRPTNIMGASKRIAELILQGLNNFNAATDQSVISAHQTCFSMVRFGNVLDSSGSVVPLFRSQIKTGGPVTVTHPDVTRYFMTIPEACQLVLQAATMSRGGEVFVLDMGAPVRIFDLARRMIRLSGLKLRTDDDPNGDIDIVITGLRPGEKLFEELLIGNNPEHTQHPSIMMATEASLRFNELVSQLGELSAALDLNDIEQLTKLLQRLVPEYTAERSIVDWTYLEQQKVGSNNQSVMRNN